MTTADTAPVPGPMLHALAKSWWLVLLRGIAGIVFGVLAFVWPGLTLLALVILYGAYALVDVAGIAAGIVTFVWPGMTAFVLIIFIGAWAIVHGIFEIVGAIRLRKEIDNEWWLILAGALSVIFGIIVLVAPGAGALGLIWVIGAYSIAFGILLVGLS